MPVIRYDLEDNAAEFAQHIRRAADAMEDAARSAMGATKATDKLAKAQRDTSNRSSDLEKGLKGLEKIAMGFEGQVSGTVGVVADFTEGLIEAKSVLGPVGVAIGGATLAAAGLAFAVVGLAQHFSELARSAGDALDELEEMNVAVPAEIAERIERMNDELDRAALEAKRLLVAFVGASDEGADLATIAADLTGDLADLAEQIGPVVKGFALMRRVATGFVTLGYSEIIPLVRDLAQGFGELDNEITTASEALVEFIEKGREAGKVYADGGVADLAAWGRRQERAHQDAQKAAEERAKAAEKEEARLQAAREKRFGALILLQEGLQEAEAERVASALEREEALNEARAEQYDLVKQAANEAAEAAFKMSEQAQEQLQFEADLRDRMISQLGQIGDGLQEIAANNVERFDRERERLEATLELEGRKFKDQRKYARARLGMLDKQQRRQETLAMVGFALQKTSAISQITIDTAKAALALLSSPFIAALGPGAPVAALGIAGGLAGTQIAAVLSAPPPKLHDGGLVSDEVPATLRRGESVLNQRATQSMGREGVEALNRGEQMPQRGVVVFDGRVVGDLMVREQRRPGSPLAVGSAPKGRRSPYGGT
jgi:hypothetical protein